MAEIIKVNQGSIMVMAPDADKEVELIVSGLSGDSLSVYLDEARAGRLVESLKKAFDL